MDQHRFDRSEIEAAVAVGALSQESAARFGAFLDTRAPQQVPSRPRFDLTHVFWYAGALIVMGAMGLFSTQAFSQMGGKGLAITGFGYFIVLGFAGDRLWQKDETRTPGGLLIAVAIGMVPMIVFGLQEAGGNWIPYSVPGIVPIAPGCYRSFYQSIKGGWVPMELATILISLLAMLRYNFSFIAFPAIVALWFLSMDLAALLAGDLDYNFKRQRTVSLWFGLGTFLGLWLFELKRRSADFAFWIHIVAAVTFWGGLTLHDSDKELAKFLYCMINIALLLITVFFRRNVYAVFGAIGIMLYLSHLAEKVFKDSLLFPFALSVLGLALIGFGLWFAKNRAWFEAKMHAAIPAALMALRPVPPA